MQIIDYEKKGNVVRFYLGDDNDREYWGDDWDDAPYDCNAEVVYDEYVKGYVDVAFPFDSLVLEPCDGVLNTSFTKEDMKNRRVPCIIVVSKDKRGDSWKDGFSDWVGAKDIKKFYFGDKMDCYENGSYIIWGDRILED